MVFAPSELWRRSQEVAFVDTQDRVVVLRLDSPEAPPLLLAGAAATVWRLLDEPRSARSLHAAALEISAHDEAGDPPEVHQALTSALTTLGDLGLVLSAS